MLYTSSQELKEACCGERDAKRLEDMQEGQDPVTDSHESEKGGHAEDHVKGCALGERRYHFTGKVRK